MNAKKIVNRLQFTLFLTQFIIIQITKELYSL